MEVQPQLVLLQKTLLYIEGLGRQLYPELDLWKTAKPFLENWVNEQMGVKALFQSAKSNLPYWIEKAPMMPELVFHSLQSVKQLPEMKQDLINQYRQQQRQQQRFFAVLATFTVSLPITAAMFLFADLSLIGWQVAVAIGSYVSLASALKLRASTR